jgi:basic amino acid/polyamine antiporter, APA family
MNPSSSSPHSGSSSSLMRQLGLFDSSMIMVGIVIGSGIFLTSGIMAKSIPSAPLLLLAWLACGLLTLAGALTYGELGAAMPEAGGQYVYLREAYGSLAGFLFGWILFLVYMTGGIAGLALAFAEYFGVFFPAVSMQNTILSLRIPLFGNMIPYSLSAGQIIGVSVIIMLSLLNVFGVRLGKSVQNFFTVLKIGTISAIVIFGLTVGKGASVNWVFNPRGLEWSSLLIGFGVALVGVAWSFDGWNNVNFVAGEIKNPEKTLPRALILGTLGVTLLYLLTNLVYLRALPLSSFIGEVRIAESAVTALYGASFGAAVSALVVVSTFGSLNGSILAGPRVYYAMAKDGLFSAAWCGFTPSTGLLTSPFCSRRFGLPCSLCWEHLNKSSHLPCLCRLSSGSRLLLRFSGCGKPNPPFRVPIRLGDILWSHGCLFWHLQEFY